MMPDDDKKQSRPRGKRGTAGKESEDINKFDYTQFATVFQSPNLVILASPAEFARQVIEAQDQREAELARHQREALRLQSEIEQAAVWVRYWQHRAAMEAGRREAAWQKFGRIMAALENGGDK